MLRARILTALLTLPLALAACDDGDDAKSDDKAGDAEKKDGDAEKKDGDAEKKDGDAEKKDGDAEKKDGGSDAAGGEPKLGDKCEGLDPSAGLMGCDGNTQMYCSSHSEYVWTKTNDCPEGKKCVKRDEKSVGCE